MSRLAMASHIYREDAVLVGERARDLVKVVAATTDVVQQHDWRCRRVTPLEVVELRCRNKQRRND